MTTFAKTRLTLLSRLAGGTDAATEAAWGRFFETYHSPMLRFVEAAGGAASSEDIVQRVMAKLVKVFREGDYHPRPGAKFRSYLCTLLHNELLNWWSGERVRIAAEGRFAATATTQESGDPGAAVDALWRIARHEAAVNHVLVRMACDGRTKAAYRAAVLEGRPNDEVCGKFGLSAEDLASIKYRINRRIAEVERRYSKEPGQNGKQH